MDVMEINEILFPTYREFQELNEAKKEGIWSCAIWNNDDDEEMPRFMSPYDYQKYRVKKYEDIDMHDYYMVYDGGFNRWTYDTDLEEWFSEGPGSKYDPTDDIKECVALGQILRNFDLPDQKSTVKMCKNWQYKVNLPNTITGEDQIFKMTEKDYEKYRPKTINELDKIKGSCLLLDSKDKMWYPANIQQKGGGYILNSKERYTSDEVKRFLYYGEILDERISDNWDPID